MTWQQKLAALQCLGDCSLKMREPGDWYVSQSRVEVGGDGMLAGSYGNGETPVVAVTDHWRVLVDELPVGKHLVLGASSDDRRAVRWNGYMWADVQEATP